MSVRPLVLSSSSTARKQLLARLGIPFSVISPDIDETPHLGELPTELVLRLARTKAEATAATYPEAIIIGADTVGILHGELLHKPITQDNAVKQLQQMSGQTVQFYTGLCVLDARENKCEIGVEEYHVTFRELTISMIENYLRLEAAHHCAGSCQIEGLGIALVRKLSGRDYTALIGLPLIQLTCMLETMGVRVL